MISYFTACQTEIETRDFGIQCDLLSAPMTSTPLQCEDKQEDTIEDDTTMYSLSDEMMLECDESDMINDR